MLGKRWNNVDMTVYTVKGRFTNMWDVQRQQKLRLIGFSLRICLS